MITIKKEIATDIVNILASGIYTKYTWTQVNAYINELSQKVVEAQKADQEPQVPINKKSAKNKIDESS